LRVAGDGGFQDRPLLKRIADGLEDRVENYGFTHDRSGFRQGHGRVGLHGGLTRLVGTVIMETMPQFMRQGHDLVEGTVKVGHDAAFPHGIHAHTEGSAAFTRTLLRVNPMLLKGTPGELSQFR